MLLLAALIVWIPLVVAQNDNNNRNTSHSSAVVGLVIGASKLTSSSRSFSFSNQNFSLFLFGGSIQLQPLCSSFFFAAPCSVVESSVPSCGRLPSGRLSRCLGPLAIHTACSMGIPRTRITPRILRRIPRHHIPRPLAFLGANIRRCARKRRRLRMLRKEEERVQGICRHPVHHRQASTTCMPRSMLRLPAHRRAPISPCVSFLFFRFVEAIKIQQYSPYFSPTPPISMAGIAHRRGHDLCVILVCFLYRRYIFRARAAHLRARIRISGPFARTQTRTFGLSRTLDRSRNTVSVKCIPSLYVPILSHVRFPILVSLPSPQLRTPLNTQARLRRHVSAPRPSQMYARAFNSGASHNGDIVVFFSPFLPGSRARSLSFHSHNLHMHAPQCSPIATCHSSSHLRFPDTSARCVVMIARCK
ncbi:hypothetical protein C8R47DRAFT_1169737 [Mycena vitilis]|nr:hypothetical protein C8R47DRAFT_1169737 [Mycena vitilis]